ncbi:hypothetical protein PISMIDRAFT_102709 [Pisolithus microcarpus 441]|uniref:DUF6532 domain-containing protein n=1 Tax=Pisolithus microcarpus 441 TaxID=765257 RepID=A0A0C9YBY1_9AGAM|nr:hypothetical protein BKA83DRAFT_102709 [Pisolithus microcarpus]KIK22255.1 hypothetical protein PISMIDRAFT_102709 [Pisolithus microcarpus 441]
MKTLVINNTSKGWPKAANYDADVPAVLKTVIEVYCVILLMENTFPSSVQEVDWVKKAWTLACHHHNIKLTIDGGILKLVHGSSLHKHTGLYTNPAIQQIINEVLFKNKLDDAIKWEKYYNPFPTVTFTLTLMAVGLMLTNHSTVLTSNSD